MQSKSFIGAAVLLALAPATLAMGSATVVNNCGFPVYYAAVGQNQGASMQEISGSVTQPYGADGDGISIKLSPNDSASGAISQFEITLSGGKIFYDISNINGYPFSAGGMTVVPSMEGDASNPTCVEIDCPAGQSVCSAAYNAPDDTRTMVCSDESNLVLTMCPGGSSKRSESPALGHLHHRVHARHLPKK